jgi:hypothetical protein
MGGEEKGEGVAGTEGNAGDVSPQGTNGSGSIVTTVEGEYGGGCLGEPAGVEEAGSQPWEDGVGEEIGVEDWREEELGDEQREPVRSQVREESLGKGLGGVLNFKGSLSPARRI